MPYVIRNVASSCPPQQRAVLSCQELQSSGKQTGAEVTECVSIKYSSSLLVFQLKLNARVRQLIRDGSWVEKSNKNRQYECFYSACAAPSLGLKVFCGHRRGAIYTSGGCCTFPHLCVENREHAVSHPPCPNDVELHFKLSAFLCRCGLLYSTRLSCVALFKAIPPPSLP